MKRLLRQAGWLTCVAVVLAAGCVRISRSDAASKPGTESTPAPLAEFFCLNGIKPFHDKVGGEAAQWDDLQRRLAAARALGAHGMRVDMWWGVIEPAPGRFEWEFPNRVLRETAFVGLEPYPIFCYNAAWDPDHSPATAEAREAFGRYVRGLVERNKDRTKYWEVWNEPNIRPFWVPEPDPALYTELLRVAYREAKAADPDCVVVGICTAGPDYRFIEEVYRLGGGAHLDAVSYHHYSGTTDERELETEIRRIREIMRRHGDGAKPLYITELGLSTGASPVVREVSEEQQASWIVKKHLVSIASGVDRLYYFKLVDDDPVTDPDGYWGLYDWKWRPKIARDAYAAMVSRLAPSQFIGRVHRQETHRARAGETEVQLYRHRSGEVFAYAWVREDGADAAVHLPADGEVTVEDMSGKIVGTERPDARGLVSVTLTKHPRILRGLSPRALALAAVRFDPPDLFLAPGEARTVTVTVANPLQEPLEIGLESLLRTPAESGVTVTAPQSTLTAPAGGTASVELTAHMDAGAKGYQSMILRHGVAGAYSYEYRLFRDEALAIRVRAGHHTAGQIAVEATITNRRSVPLRVQGHWAIDGKPRLVRRAVIDLAPGGEHTFGEPCDVKPGETIVTASATATDGATASRDFHIWGQPLRAQAPTIDGDLGEWHDVPAVRLSPEHHLARGKTDADFGGEVKVLWTSDALYVAADVSDATPLLNPHEGGELWRGDALELYLGFGGPTRRTIYGEGQFQVGISPGEGGANPFAWNWKPLNPANAVEAEKGRRISGAEIAVRQTDRGYRIEARIPLAEFGRPIAPGQVLGFDVHLNDKSDAGSDGNQAALIWNGTGANWQDPSNWGVAVVLGE